MVRIKNNQKKSSKSFQSGLHPRSLTKDYALGIVIHGSLNGECDENLKSSIHPANAVSARGRGEWGGRVAGLHARSR